MAELPTFGVLLARLVEHRKLDVGALSRAAAVPEPELAAVLDGAVPSPSLLRRLAPALHLHTSDLFVIAGLAVPDDLAPMDPKASRMLDGLVWTAIYLPAQGRRLRELVRSLPQEARTQPVPPPAHHRYPPGLGAVLVRMLHNRNLNWVASAKCLYGLAGIGPLSASTVAMVGHGRKALSPDLVAGFATVLGIPAGDVAALTGVDAPDGTGAVHPTAADAVELIWDARRLTASQMRQVCDQAHAMRQ